MTRGTKFTLLGLDPEAGGAGDVAFDEGGD
jgi:hypothetical protein